MERLTQFPLQMSPRSFLAFLLALGLAGCTKQTDPLTSAQTFFRQVANGQAELAWQSAAFGFQAQRNATVFATAAKEMGLADAVDMKWEAPERDGRSVKIRVTIRTREGKTLPFIVTLLNETGAWRVFSLRSPPSETTGISENRFTLVGKAPAPLKDVVNTPVPSEQELRQLVRENLLRFNEAIVAKSFDSFYDSVAVKWQEQLTKGQLQRAFQPFIDKKINIALIEKVDPIWTSAIGIGTDGLLNVSGYYPTKPYEVYFSLKFFYELPAWKLFGLDVNLRK